MALALLVLVAPVLALAADPAPAPAVEGVKAEAAPEKPAVRALQVKSRGKGTAYLFKLTLVPGVPDPGRAVSVGLELFELPPVPDPIHGEQVPLKDASLVAEVTDADGAGYTMVYEVHPLQDAGTYGFHTTPVRQDTYRVVLRGEHNGRKLSGTFRLSAGLWPIPGGDDEAAPSEDAGGGGRMPAMPGGMKGPAVPGGRAAAPAEAPAEVAPSKPGTPLAGVMERLGEGWVELQVALFGGRVADLARAKALAGPLKTTALAAAGLRPPEADFDRLLQETAEALGALAGAKDPVQAFQRIAANQCNQCHLVYRWNVIGSLAEFPGGLP